MNIVEAVEWMSAQRKKGQGFSQFAKYLNEQGNELSKLKIIHVAGTNGKGSVVCMLMSVLKEAGYKVGSFTSPHLRCHQDRIRINNHEIPEDDFLRLFHQKKDVWEAYGLSMFEMDLDLASHWFVENQIDVAIIEAGIGGRNDSTNVIETSLASVIVSVGLDHMDRLGNTVEQIACEKAGIIKERGLVICGLMNESCQDVVYQSAEKQQATFCPVHPVEILSESPVKMKYRDLEIELSMPALYQSYNAACAIETLIQLRDEFKVEDNQIISGLKKAHWAGRFDVISDHPVTIVDGAHNAHGMAALKESVKILRRPVISVFACLKDKDKEDMIKELMMMSDEVILTEFDFYRAMKLDDFHVSDSVIKIKDWHEAIKKARSQTKTGTVLITGSLYFISEVLEWMKSDNV